MSAAELTSEIGYRGPFDIETGFHRDVPAGPSNHVPQELLASGPVHPEAGTADFEVARILRVQHNYYAVLLVEKDSPSEDIRTNYYKLSRLVHPDKCRSNDDSSSASAAVNLAYDTLRNPIKKKLYDSYVEDKGLAPDSSNMTYAEWEAKQAHVELPRWLETLLRVPGCGPCLLICLSPFLLLLGLLVAILYIACLPFKLLLGICMPSKAKQPDADSGSAFRNQPPTARGFPEASARPGASHNSPSTPQRPPAVGIPPSPHTPPPGVMSDGNARHEAPYSTTPQAFAISLPGPSPGTKGLLDSWSHISTTPTAALRHLK